MYSLFTVLRRENTMNGKKEILIFAAAMLVTGAHTDSITHGTTTVNMDFTTIGHAGNAAQSAANRAHSGDGGDGFGAVDYAYRIGTFEVTVDQWNRVVGSNTYDPNTGYGNAQEPVQGINWLEAARYCNWLTTGSYEQGAYRFGISGGYLGVDRDSAVAAYGTVYVLPTADEWYKAAYFQADGGGYTLYSTGDALPLAGTNGINYNYAVSNVWNVGTGSGISIENNGTFDMNGNAAEWTESNSSRLLGGAYHNDEYYLNSSNFFGTAKKTAVKKKAVAKKANGSGFRVAVIPEPSSVALMGLVAGLGWFVCQRFRK